MGGNDVNIETSGTDATNNIQNNLTVTNRNKVFNGTTWDRVRSALSDAMAATGISAFAGMLWNGATWDRPQSDVTGKQKVSLYGNFSVAGDTSLKATTGGILRTSLNINSTPVDPTNDGDNQGINNSSVLSTARSYLLNATTWDRQRNNYESTVLASASRSSDTNSSDQTNYNAKGVIITIDLTILNSTSLTFTITYKDSLSGKYQTLLASTALVGTGTTSLTIYPGATVTANLSLSMPLPRIYRIQSVRGGTPGADTYSISANYIV